ncbi:MAG TPA: DUF4190 domain-containing protein [Thermoleophilaceae bacterium]|nr:DUF4190 domain-containing protein [Thermoleophilaceae bacterium]
MAWQPQSPPGPPQQQGWYQPPPQSNNDMAVVALCLSLGSLGILVVGTPFTFGFSLLVSGPLAIGGLVVGVIARQKADRGEAGGRGMAQAAFVLGIVSLVLHVVAVVLGVALIALLIESLDDFDVPEPDKAPDAEPAWIGPVR